MSKRVIWLAPVVSTLAAVAGLSLLLRSPIPTDLSTFVTDGLVPVVIAIAYGGIGALLISRDASRTLGALMCVISAVFGVVLLAAEYAIQGLAAAPGSLPAAVYGAWFAQWVFAIFLPCGIGLLFLLFPTGRPPGRGWNWVLGLLLAGSVIAVFMSMFQPGRITASFRPVPLHVTNPFGIAAVGAVVAAGWPWLVLIAVAVAGIASMFWRYWRADTVERHQVKWLAYVATVLVLCVPFVFLQQNRDSQGGGAPVDIAFLVLVIAFSSGVPVAIAIAVLRYRLYDIDVVISRTLAYGSLAALITGVYVGVAVGIGALVGSGGRPNLGLSILATAIVAIGFQPARERLQRIANRLVYGRRATPYQVLSQFSSQVAGSYAADEVLPRMARLLQAGTGADAATVWLKADGELHPAATWPEDASARVMPVAMPDGVLPRLPNATRSIDVRQQGELLGVLSVVKRRGESLTPVEEKLLGDLAHQAGLVLKNAGLTADLQRRLDELRASRQRLVSAQDAERRRLERNLHDGAQQHLVALKVKLGLAEMLTSRDPEKAQATLRQLKADTDEALETLRDLARGIYPPLLAEKGLAAALGSQARKSTVPVTVDAGGIGRYSQEVEATVYFCVLEALQNVQKYAHAERATVRVREDDGSLAFAVEDDGRGFDAATARRGAGLTNMQDRIAALDGAVEVASAPGRGTRISARIPLRENEMVA